MAKGGTTMSSSLYFRHVGKTFRTKKSSVQALRDVSFDVPDGQFTAIVGPSGCGKSTLLSLAAGLDTDFEGQIDRPKDASYGFLFQTPRLLPWLTAEKNVTFILKTVQGKTSAEAKEIARHYLHLV